MNLNKKSHVKLSKKTRVIVLTLVFILSGISFAPNSNAVAGYPLTPFYQVSGKYTLSTDGLGTTSSSGTLQVEKPSSQATVKKAFLMASQKSGGNSSPTPRASLESTQISYSKEVSGQTLSDVTSIVAPVVDAASAGIINLTLSGANNAEGYALAVVFYDPSLQYSGSVVLSFGRADTVGSTTKFDFSSVLSKQAYMDVTMSLGISFSYQNANLSDSYSCTSSSGCGQQSNISLTLDNSNTPIYISATAGGADDAAQSPTNGNLLTVGGVGDSVSKPVDSSSSTTTTTPRDNELYSLIDVLPNGTQSFSLTSSNPSANDYLFFAGFYFKGIIARGTDTSGNSSLPVITDISPCYGPTAGGTSVTITGTNLSGATAVTFGNAAGSITSNSATSIVATSPAKTAGFVDVTVTTSAGDAVQFDGFQYGDNLTGCDGSVAAASGSTPSPSPSPSNSSSDTPSTTASNWSCNSGDIGRVTFLGGSSKLTYTAKMRLKSYAKSIQASSCTKVVLKGHTATLTNSSPSLEAKRVQLSIDRNNSVKIFLESELKNLNVNVTFSNEIYRATIPVGSNNTYLGRLQNRRVEISVN